MNAVRKILDSNYDEVKDAICAAYEAIGVFQNDRNDASKRNKMTAAVARATDVLRAFKEYVPRYKQRYFEIESWSPLMLGILNGRREVQPYANAAQANAEEFIASGQSIVGGYIMAPAYKACGINELKRMPQGSILLTKMTTPDFIVALDNISGIATEQGGKVCHAAILAREFHIPCVVGCGGLLAAVENGDMLILDATNGIMLRQ